MSIDEDLNALLSEQWADPAYLYIPVSLNNNTTLPEPLDDIRGRNDEIDDDDNEEMLNAYSLGDFVTDETEQLLSAFSL